MDNPGPYPVRRCCINCYPNGVTVRTSFRSLQIFMILTYVSLAIMPGILSLFLYTYWYSMVDLGRAMSIFFFSMMLIPIIFHVFHVKVCLRCILKRKRIFFRRIHAVSTMLHITLDNLQRFILDEDTLTVVERQATSCVKRGISQKICEVFGNRAVHLCLTGGTAERFAVPLSSKWISIEGDIDDNHALISDFDFMLQLDQIGSSFAVGRADLTIDPYECQIGYARLVINNQTVQSVFGTNDGEKYLSAQALKGKVYQAVCDTDVSIFPGFESYAGLLCIKNSKNHFVRIKSSGPAIKLEFGTGSLLKTRMVGSNFSFFSKVDTNQFLADITFSIPCKEWPSISDWPLRRDRCWPSSEDVERIVKLGRDASRVILTKPLGGCLSRKLK